MFEVLSMMAVIFVCGVFFLLQNEEIKRLEKRIDELQGGDNG